MREQQKESVSVSLAAVVHGSADQPTMPTTEAEIAFDKDIQPDN